MNYKDIKRLNKLNEKNQCANLSLQILMLKTRYEIDSFWSFDKIREEYKEAGVPFTYREKDTPPGHYILEYPDGTKKLLRQLKIG